MTYRESLDWLATSRVFGQLLGLATMQALLAELGNPERGPRFIHIAGTNGKGSVAAMCHAALAAGGYRCGLYTSPHLVAFGERFIVNGRPASEAEVARAATLVRPAAERVAAAPGGRSPTFFEIVTAMALLHFRDQRVDVVAWETGLGGRLDATNVVTPLVAVITSIGLEHEQYLGHTLAAIAAEKAGIIKPGVPVVTAEPAPEPLAVIREVARDRGCRLVEIGREVRGEAAGAGDLTQMVRVRGTGDLDGVYEVPLLGAHQVVNCATAVAALAASGLAIAPAAVATGLRRTVWPGRFQVLPGRPTIVLDGAHNPHAAERLAVALRQRFGGQRLGLVLGVLRDKDTTGVCRILVPLAERVICVPVTSDRAGNPAELAARCREFNPQAVVGTAPGCLAALAELRAAPIDVVVVAGSLFLVGEALRELAPPFGLAPAGVSELRLQ